MTNIGRMYMYGDGIEQSWRNALRWIKRSAKLDNVSALALLGEIYGGHWDYPEDPTQAVKWLTLAAMEGVPDSMCDLGIRYANGDGVLEDDKEAVILYRLAAQQGHRWAQYLLGICYRDGNGVKQSQRWAMYWLEKSSGSGATDAAAALKGLVSD